MDKVHFWYWLCNRKGIGIRKMNSLLHYFQNPENVFHAEEKQLRNIESLTDADVKELLKQRDISLIQEKYAKLAEKGVQFITMEDVRYPERLRNIFDAPLCLYVKGKLPEPCKRTVAIVGARSCSNYGKEMAFHFANRLSESGIQVVSGLALGIDGYAHKGALKAGEPTFGVLGCGIDICYPATHIELYMHMQINGGIISEYAPGVPAKPGHFPMRNRIISGISDGVLVVEAKEKSGSLITVDMALEQGRDVFAIPGRVCDKLSIGCNNLIKMGAELVNSPEDILESYQMIGKISNTDSNRLILSPDLKEIYVLLGIEPKHINQIVEESGIGLIEVIDRLARLEAGERIKQILKNYYVIVL